MTTPPSPQPPYPGYLPPSPPPRKRHTGRNILIGICAVIGLFVVIGVIGAANAPNNPAPANVTKPAAASPSAPAAPAPAPAGHHVVYKVTASSSTQASITYNSDGTSSIQQENDAKLPWTKDITLDAEQAFAIGQVSAQNAAGGKITCEIDVDGQVVKAGTASGEYAIASCTATIK